MPADIESMMFRGETPWHGLGTRVEGVLTAEEAMRAAGLDWLVSLKPLAVKELKPCEVCTETDDDGVAVCGRDVQAAGQRYDLASVKGCVCACHRGDHSKQRYTLGEDVDCFASVRASDNKILGVVGPDWKPLQNIQAFNWFDPFVADGIAEYHTAGSLKGGSLIWVLAEIKNIDTKGSEALEVVKGDMVRRFILLSNAHDGTQSVRCGYTNIRVVCANTLAQAHGDSASRLLRVRHTGSIKERLDQIRDLMQVQHQAFVATVEQYRKLAACHDVNQNDLARYVRVVFFGPETAHDVSVGHRIVNSVVELFYKGRGQGMTGVRGTMWAAYNAVTEYLNYGRGRNKESILGNIWFGESAKLNDRALEAASEIADEKLGVKPDRPRRFLGPAKDSNK